MGQVISSRVRRAICVFVVVMLCLTSLGSIGSLGATGSIGLAGFAPLQAQAVCGVLSNGDFEQPQIQAGTSQEGSAIGWSGSYTLSNSANAHSGSQYIRVNYNAEHDVEQTLDTTGLVAGTTITISFYVSTDDYVYVQLTSSDFNSVDRFTSTNGFEQRTISIQTRYDDEPVTLSFGYYGDGTGPSIDTVTATCTPPNLPGMLNPNFAGTKATITNAASTPNTGTAKVVYDGAYGRDWTAGAQYPDYPTSASLRLDLGAAKSISGVKWKLTGWELADSFHVRLVSVGGTVLKTYGPFGNDPLDDDHPWYGVPVTETVSARYVHLVFTNPHKDYGLGQVTEVEVWHKPAGNPGAQNPSFTGSKATIVNSASTPNTGTVRNAHDGSTGTNWHSGHVTPSSASLRLDLGVARPVTGVKWKFQSLGFADSFTVRLVSAGGSVVAEYGPFTNASAAQTFFGVGLSSPMSARYVHLIFSNPNSDTALGSVSEVEVWAQATMTYPPGTQNPVPFGHSELVTITNSASTPNTGTSKNAYDGATWSNWAVQGTPNSASLRFDLRHEWIDVTDITWSFSSIGYADKFWIRLVDPYGKVTATFGPFGNATAAKTWFGVYVPEMNRTRYVHFIFENPNKDVALGAIGEVKIYGDHPYVIGSLPELKSASETGFAGEVLPVKDTQGGGSFQAASSTRESQPPEAVTYDLGEAQELTGVRWQSGQESVVGLAWSADGQAWTDTGLYASKALPGQWQGTGDVAGVEARYVRVTYHPISARAQPMIATNVEIWGLGDVPLAATPQASPEASPIPATPVLAQPEASPVPATPEPSDPGTPAASPEPATDETPAPTEEPTDEATEIPATPEPAAEEPTDEPTASETVEPTATEVIAPEPTLALTLGTITGTDGDLVNCRVSPIDGEPITQLAAGDTIDIIGPAVDGWIPVLCMGQPGYIAEEFVTIGTVDPTAAVTEPTATSEDGAEPEPSAPVTITPTEAVTEEPTPEPTVEPTEAPVETPYPVYDAGDTAGSGTAWNTVDGDPGSAWSAPVTGPQERMYLDLGAVVPIDRVTLELAWTGNLPYFELWLSEDGETWYNATPNGIDGWSLWAGEPIPVALGYDARYLRVVIPNVDASGLSEVGGIAEIAVWPGDITQTSYLTALGEPTTPTPEPAPTEEPTAEPTDEVIEEPTAEWVEEPTEEVSEEPTEAWVEPTAEWVEPTVEELPVEGGEETPPEEAAG